MNNTEAVAYWIIQRENIRRAKEAGEPRPWTKDPILAQYRFCNVHREDDAVTRWIAANWRNPNVDNPLLLRALVLARMVNWPPTLGAIGFPDPWRPQHIIDAIYNQSKRGKAWGSAYIVSTNGRSVSKPLYVVYDVCGAVPATPLRTLRGNSLQALYVSLQGYNGIGSFMAGQIIADLKNTPGHRLEKAADWWTFACPGPGSIRGIAQYFKGRTLPSHSFNRNLNVMIKEVSPLLNGSKIKRLCAQDWQNVMCEMDKYWRAKHGFRRPKADYHPNPAFP